MKVRSAEQMLHDQLIVSHFAGSHAYGTSTPESDVDIRGIFCADEIFVVSPWFQSNEITLPEEEDTKYYELTKYLQLTVDQNPNIVESLWVDDGSVIKSSRAYEYLRSVREDLLSSKAAFTYSGYAHAQLKRIKGHNKWINNPQPVKPPMHGQFLKLVQNYTTDKVFSRDFTQNYNDFLKHNELVHYGDNIFGVVSRGGVKAICDKGDFNVSAKQVDGHSNHEPPLYIIRYLQDEYKRAKTTHKDYWTWKNNRNEKRSELEEKFGYDTKHAMHLIRLLRTGKEILTEGVVRVKRPDAKELLEIRNGKLTYKEIVDYAESMDNKIKELYKKTELRKRVNVRRSTEILLEARNLAWNESLMPS